MTESYTERSGYLNSDATVFEASNPGFPSMLGPDDHGAEWDRLTEIAEHTDDPRDWECADDMEAVSDHMVFEGIWS